MASGRQPFAGASGAETLTAILRDTPVPLLQLNPQLPSKLEKIINKALDKNRDERYQATSEMRAELRSLKQAIDSGRSVAPDLRQAAGVEAAPGRSLNRPDRNVHDCCGDECTRTHRGCPGGTRLFLGRKSKLRSRSLRIVPFSGLSGMEDFPSFSPDGKRTAGLHIERCATKNRRPNHSPEAVDAFQESLPEQGS